jgi:hypothetical protein
MYPRKRYLLEDEFGPKTQMQAHQAGFYKNLPQWASETGPDVLERVSRQSPARRQTWLARGAIKEKAQDVQRQRRADMLMPIVRQQEMIRRNTPMTPREKLGLQQIHDINMLKAREGFSSRSDLLDRDFRRDLSERDIGARSEAATLAHERGLKASAINRLGQLGNWRTQQEETPKTIGQMRAEYAGDLEPGTPEYERALGITQADPYGELPSVAEQEAMILAQFEYGSPEWIQAYQQIEAIKRQPVDPVQKMLDMQRLLRGTKEVGIYGAMGETMESQKGVADYAAQQLDGMIPSGTAPSGTAPSQPTEQVLNETPALWDISGRVMVGDKVKQDGVTYIVTGFDEDGVPVGVPWPPNQTALPIGNQ